MPRPPNVLRLASFAAALAAGLPTMLAIARDGVAAPRALLVWAASFILFLALFGLLSSELCGRLPRRLAQLALLAATVCGWALIVSGRSAFAGVFPALLAAMAPAVLPARPASVWLAAQVAATGVAFALAGFGAAEVALLALAFGALQLFAFQSARTAMRERAARQALETAHRELEAARLRLAEGARLEERLRISRDLHDVMGHHLTALSLALEAATHTQPPRSTAHVEEARALAKSLLQDVRRVVSALREERPPDLAAELRRLAASVPPLQIHIRVSPGLALAEAPAAHALLGCVQEIVTNARRHSGAANLWIDLERDGEGLAVRAHDDGRGVESAVAGHGLRGMEERLVELGGRLRWSSRAGQGFTVEGWLPAAEARP